MEKNYSGENKNRIVKIDEGSIAEELGVEVGDRLLSINGREVNDIIDYIYLLADEYVEVDFKNPNFFARLLDFNFNLFLSTFGKDRPALLEFVRFQIGDIIGGNSHLFAKGFEG